jgi:hypothetical protein
MLHVFKLPLAGLVPAFHAFLPLGGVLGEDVGGRNKSGQGGSWVVAMGR